VPGTIAAQARASAKGAVVEKRVTGEQPSVTRPLALIANPMPGVSTT
jgi:hypothetical protein